MKTPIPKTDPVTMRSCGSCGQITSVNSRGQVLMHTRGRYGLPAEVCPGSVRGARP